MASPGDRVWFVADPGGKLRPAIVVSVSADGLRALVMYGTGTAGRDIPSVAIDPKLRVSAVARLSKPTWFYQTNVRVCAVDELQRNEPPATCPRAYWEEIKRLALAGCHEKLTKMEIAEWWPNAASPSRNS